MSDEIVALVTCPADQAERIASALVEERLAACVNIVPGVKSIYRWKGEICKDDEQLMVIKSHRRLWSLLEQRILELHTYEVPEIICFPIELAHKPYLNWINCQLGDEALSSRKET